MHKKIRNFLLVCGLASLVLAGCGDSKKQPNAGADAGFGTSTVSKDMDASKDLSTWFMCLILT